MLTLSQWRAVEKRNNDLATARASMRYGLNRDPKERKRENLKFKWESLWEVGDSQALIIENNKRLNLDPINGAKSCDPVYRKLTKLINYIGELGYMHPYAGLEGSLREKANQLQTHIENRTMQEQTYSYLLKTSRKDILDYWAAEERK